MLRTTHSGADLSRRTSKASTQRTATYLAALAKPRRVGGVWLVVTARGARVYCADGGEALRLVVALNRSGGR